MISMSENRKQANNQAWCASLSHITVTEKLTEDYMNQFPSMLCIDQENKCGN